MANYVGVTYIPPKGMDSNYYIVKKGDSLYSIARNYGVTVNELKSANNLTSNNLSIGMNLIIPSENKEPSSEEYYIVKAGDSLYKIANMYHTTVNELKSLNNLSSNLLSIGQRLRVITNTELPANTYVVKSGDSLYSIAKKYGISVDALKSANNKTTNLLTIGEVLIIPTSNEVIKTYTVKSGDTLYGIARTYNTTVEAIKSLNGLNNNNLSIGMVLKLPI